MRLIKVTLASMLGMALASCSHNTFVSMGVGGFAEETQKEGTQIVDVRTAEEYAQGHIEGARNIDVKQADFISMAKSQLNKKQPVAVYCRSGRRSAMAAEQLTAQGYKCINLEGGILAWEEAQKPVVQ